MDIPFPRQMGNRSSQALKLQQHLYDQMLSQSDFCDVTLVINDTKIKAHWNVLVSCPYFHCLYDSDLSEKQSGTINLQIGKPSSVRAAISFLYIGTTEVTYENVRDLLEVADYFQIMDLKKACQDYLCSVSITVDNCVNISLLSSLYDLDLYSKAFQFLKGNLPDVLSMEDTLSLTTDSILSLLTDETLNYVSPESFYNFIVRWTNHSLSERQDFFEALFCELDLSKVSKQFLEEVIETESLVQSHEKCKIHVLNIKMKYMTGLLTPDSGKREVILLAGGCGHGHLFNNLIHLFPFNDCISVSNIYGYVVQEKRWIEFAPLPESMKKPLLAFNPEGYLYVFNNALANAANNYAVYKYEFQEKIWRSFRILVDDSITSLLFHNLIWSNGALYAVVSAYVISDASSAANNCKQWQTILLHLNETDGTGTLKTVFFPRNSNTVVTVCVHNKTNICVMGFKHGSKMKKGRSKNTSKFLVYDTLTGSSTEYSKGLFYENTPMLFQRNDELIITKFGKVSGKIFNFADKKWRVMKDLLLPHLPNKAEVLEYSSYCDGDKFYIFGGKEFNSKTPLETAHCYSFKDKMWSPLEEMPQKLMLSGTCAVTLPKEAVKCHIKCPHCIYHTRKGQAVYDIDVPFDYCEYEDETEYDFSEDEDDDDYYQSDFDHWVEHFEYFDPYEMEMF